VLFFDADTAQLSEKYDRERLGLATSTAARGKERDLAPHLNTASGSRVSSGSQTNTTSRRAEAREPARKRAGDNADDWRKGTSLSLCLDVLTQILLKVPTWVVGATSVRTFASALGIT
jgi:hypothetical protein